MILWSQDGAQGNHGSVKTRADVHEKRGFRQVRLAGRARHVNLVKTRLSGSFHVSVEEGENFESGIRCWNIGTCFVSLTPRQYAALKTKFPRKGLDHA